MKTMQWVILVGCVTCAAGSSLGCGDDDDDSPSNAGAPGFGGDSGNRSSGGRGGGTTGSGATGTGATGATGTAASSPETGTGASPTP